MFGKHEKEYRSLNKKQKNNDEETIKAYESNEFELYIENLKNKSDLLKLELEKIVEFTSDDEMHDIVKNIFINLYMDKVKEIQKIDFIINGLDTLSESEIDRFKDLTIKARQVEFKEGLSKKTEFKETEFKETEFKETEFKEKEVEIKNICFYCSCDDNLILHKEGYVCRKCYINDIILGNKCFHCKTNGNRQQRDYEPCKQSNCTNVLLRLKHQKDEVYCYYCGNDNEKIIIGVCGPKCEFLYVCNVCNEKEIKTIDRFIGI